MSDLRERVPGHSLIDELLHQWDLGTIRIDGESNDVVIDDEAEGWYRGVIGERRVAAILEGLSDEWTVLHSVPVGTGSSDIDHILIGPPGVFTINTKFSPGKHVWVAGRGMYVGGSKQHYVTNAIFEAKRASNFLSRASGLTVPVTWLIVFVDPAKMTHKAAAGGDENDPPILVLRETELARTLSRRFEFSETQVARIVDAAVLPETWTPTPVESTKGSHISMEFEALQEAIGPRLEAPWVKATAPAGAARVKRSASSTRPKQRPSSPSRNRGKRKPRQSQLEKLLTGLVAPTVILTAVWIWSQSPH
jgi:Nuclease-related domain